MTWERQPSPLTRATTLLSSLFSDNCTLERFRRECTTLWELSPCPLEIGVIGETQGVALIGGALLGQVGPAGRSLHLTYLCLLATGSYL